MHPPARIKAAQVPAPALSDQAPPAKAAVERIAASVLNVEDEQALRVVVGCALAESGCDVVFATNGKEALASLEEVLPDLVISDVNMPTMDGFELLRSIRTRESTRALPVILLTGRGDTEDIVAGWAWEQTTT